MKASTSTMGQVKGPNAPSYFWQALKNSSIQRKLTLAVSVTGLISLLGLGATILIIDRSLRDQITNQAKSELSILALNYNSKLDQSILGFGGQAEDSAVATAVERGKSDLSIRSIIQTEVTDRGLEYIVLVDRERRIVEVSGKPSGNFEYGRVYDPQGLVAQSIDTNSDVVANEIVSYTDLQVANAKRAEELGTQSPNLLARYTVRPIANAAQDVVGAVVFVEILNDKTAIVDATNKTVGSGYAAIAVDRDVPVAASILTFGKQDVLKPKTFPGQDAAMGLTIVPGKEELEAWKTAGGASYAPVVSNSVVTLERSIDGSTYTLAIAPILNSAGQPIATLIRGTGHTALNSLLTQTTLLVVGIGFITVITGLLLAQAAGRLIAVPLRNLERVAGHYAEGDLSTRAEVTSLDEVGVLATVFNQMADNIQQRDRDQAAARASVEAQNLFLQDEVAHLLDIVSELESGNLIVQARVSDQATGLIADTLNRLIEQLSTILATVLNTTQEVTRGAESLEDLAISVAQNAQEQVQSVEQARQGMESVNQLAQGAAQQALAANQAVQQAQSAVTLGQIEITHLTESINQLQKGTAQMVRRIKTLGEFVDLAKQFVQDQKRLASLTQVLAMNASMVAARAMEQRDPDQFASVSREFEAIATQVNNLATQTNQGLVVLQQRTGFIEIVVSGIDQDVADVNQLVSDFTTGVEQSNQSFNNITTITERVAEVGQSVTQSSQEIAVAVKSSFESIQNIAAVADRSASQARFTRERSAEMGEIARHLLDDVRFFRIPSEKMQQAISVRSVVVDDAPALAASGARPVLSSSNGSNA